MVVGRDFLFFLPSKELDLVAVEIVRLHCIINENVAHLFMQLEISACSVLCLWLVTSEIFRVDTFRYRLE